MFGGVVIYFVLLGIIFSDIFYKFVLFDIYIWLVISVCIVLLGFFIRRVLVIVWISMILVFGLMLFIFIIIIYFIIQYKDMLFDKILFFDINNFFIGFGVIVFSYIAYVVFFGVEGSMKYFEQYFMMMNVVFLIVVIVKVAFGFFLVLRFGIRTN